MSNSSTASVLIDVGAYNPSNGKWFIPAETTISRGTVVTWKNNDVTMHTVTSGTPEGGDSGVEFDSSYIEAGYTFEHTFNTVGTFDYYCTLHPFMTGKVIVN